MEYRIWENLKFYILILDLKYLRILFTGGGTGGHIYPIVAVAEKLNKLGQEKNIALDLYYIGVPENYGETLNLAGIKVSKIISAKFRRYFDLRNVIDIPKLFISVLQAFWKIFFLMPDVLFSKGGPGALPVVLACKFYNIPIIIHESDSVAGLTNLISSRYANRIGISFESAQESFVNYSKNENEREIIIDKIALIGNPIRNDFLKSDINQTASKKIFGFDEQKPLIMVICGSQGSMKVNDFFLNSARDLVLNGFQILHQTGVKNYEQFNKELNIALADLQREKSFYKAIPYFEENIKNAYDAADLVVSRSGSGSIFEIAAMKKPSILIPLADSASDHQRKNAYEYAKTGAAIVIEELNLKTNIIISQLKKMFDNLENLKKMSLAAGQFSKSNSAELIAEEIIKLGGNT